MHTTTRPIRFHLALGVLALGLTMIGLVVGDALASALAPTPWTPVGSSVPVAAPAPAPAPTVEDCTPVGPGNNGVADEVRGMDFAAWRDAVVEDGTLDYSHGVWSLRTWDGPVEVIGFAPAEDAPIFATAECAASFAR